MKSVSKQELVKLLSICGQVAEHKSGKMQEHGRNEDEILSALSPGRTAAAEKPSPETAESVAGGPQRTPSQRKLTESLAELLRLPPAFFSFQTANPCLLFP